jgi:hypothetical protein
MATFPVSTAKTATVSITVTPSGQAMSVEVWMGLNTTTKAATSGKRTFTSTGAAQSVACPITMPATAATYKVYIDVFQGTVLISSFVSNEDVIVTAVTPVTGILNGMTRDSATGSALPGVTVNMNGVNVTSDTGGNYVFPAMPVATYTVTYSKTLYTTVTQSIAIVAGTKTVDVSLPVAPISAWWKPSSAAPIHWQWVIGSAFTMANVLPNVTVYDIDMEDTAQSVVDGLHALGYKVIAYMSCGTSEDWRSDYSRFTAADKGNAVGGWAGENWLDTRSANVRAIMTDRFARAKAKGFDAVEPDNIDGYTNNPGFPLTAATQLNYNQWIADTCHGLGLSVGLKNDVDQINSLQPYFDWALNEECLTYQECSGYSSFINAGKSVFHVEYKSYSCTSLNTMHVNSMRRNLDLTAAGTRVPCIPDTQNTW